MFIWNLRRGRIVRHAVYTYMTVQIRIVQRGKVNLFGLNVACESQLVPYRRICLQATRKRV